MSRQITIQIVRLGKFEPNGEKPKKRIQFSKSRAYMPTGELHS